jgi:hypothetical protein
MYSASSKKPMKPTKPAYNKPLPGKPPVTGGPTPNPTKPRPVTGGPMPKPDAKVMAMKERLKKK